jgi:phosphoribosyl 1,2-cyclic phosphodiesterase
VDVTILGCRGSTPATGTAFARYGGDTSSVAVAKSGQPPRLLLDAGTGLRRVADLLDGEPFRGSILLSHLHWDHTHGLPFAPAVDRDDAEVDLYLPSQGGGPLEVLSRAMSPPHFPITPGQLRGRWRFHWLDAGIHQIEGFEVLAAEVPHKGGRTFGYRVSDEGASLAYIPDYWLTEADSEPVDLVSEVDLLLHDSQHIAAEMEGRAFLGHSSVEYVIGMARRRGVGHVSLFHHDPGRSDDEIDEIVAQHGAGEIEVTAAAAGRGYRL